MVKALLVLLKIQAHLVPVTGQTYERYWVVNCEHEERLHASAPILVMALVDLCIND